LLLTNPTSVTPKILAVDVNETKLVEPLKKKVFIIDDTQTIEGFKARIILKDNAVRIFQGAYPVLFALRAMLDDKIDSPVKEGKIFQVFQSD